MIEAQGLTMVYGPVVAAQDVSFVVRPGEIMGLLGPNGAGKTTVLRMLATQIVPVSGTARVAGADILTEPQRVRENLGFLPEVSPLYDQMEVGEYLTFVAEARRLGPRKRERLEWVVETCDLEDVWYQPISQLSKGYRQRVGLAQALIHDPPCLILDEPTSGLDPLQIVEIRRLIRDLAREKAIIFSTHILQEVEVLADWVTIINEGRVVAKGRLRELAREVSREVVLRLKTGSPVKGWERLSGIELIEASREDGLYVYRLRSKDPPEERLTRFLCAEGVTIFSLERESEDLEHLFLSLVARQKGGES
ncbi:MAG: ABC transporter ATP-binding protein [Thermodesulfobacteria bacterium]|nr:ABC transporter ATP-binding protein [Thermodesulfobacteriota bacterium]